MAAYQFKELMSGLLKISLITCISIGLIHQSVAQHYASTHKNFITAEKQFVAGDCKAALQTINAYISKKSENLEAYLLRGMINECLEHPKEAIVDYSLALELKQDNTEVLFNRAILRHQVGQYQMAVEDLQKILSTSSQPTNMVYYKKLPSEEGINGISTMETMKSEVYNQLGLTHLKLDRFNKARLYFDSAISIQAKSMYFNNRGLAYKNLREDTHALDDFEKALQKDSLNSSAMFNMLDVLEDKTSADAKIEKLSRLIENDKSLPEIYTQRGLAFYEQGNYAAAIKDFDVTIELESENPDHYINRALAYSKINNYKEALDDLAYAIGLQSNYPKIYLNRGNVYFEMKQFEKAVNDYDIALLHDPDNAAVYYNRAMAWLSLKSNDKACQDLYKASGLGLKKADKHIKAKCSNQ